MATWGLLVWVVLTWTRTLEQLAFGAVFALFVALMLAPVGPVVRPWKILSPRRLVGLVLLVARCAVRVLYANVGLARRIWDPRLPIRPGMVVVPTQASSDGDLTLTGLLTSLIVDNQIVDLDRSRKTLLYHSINVPPGPPEQTRESVNGPVEELLGWFR